MSEKGDGGRNGVFGMGCMINDSDIPWGCSVGAICHFELLHGAAVIWHGMVWVVELCESGDVFVLFLCWLAGSATAADAAVTVAASGLGKFK